MASYLIKISGGSPSPQSQYPFPHAVLYNPETMPPDLVKAHNELDRAVDSCYGKTSFKTERERIEFLFDLYDKYAQLLINEKSK